MKYAEPQIPEVGRCLALSLPRRVMCDMLAFAKAVPSVPVQRRVNVASVATARAALATGAAVPGWCALFAKAYGIAATRFPELRRAYLSFPTPHIYEHPYSVASVAFEREYQGEKVVLGGCLRYPERQPLSQLQGHLRHFKDTPIESIRNFRRALLVARFPLPVRRLVWWLGLNVSGARRAAFFGTFGISVYSSLGAESLHPISPLTGILNYGPIAADGGVSVRLVYDHRVVDGANVARFLGCLEEVLNTEVVQELRDAAQVRAA